MGQILQFIRPCDVFDPETLVISARLMTRPLRPSMTAANHSLCAKSWPSASSTLRQWVNAIQIDYVKLHSARLARDRHSIV
jgi:hypothetical protein